MIKKFFIQKELILLFIFVSIISLFLISIFFFGWSETWSFLKIPPMDPIFADMRIIQGALKTQLLGQYRIVMLQQQIQFYITI